MPDQTLTPSELDSIISLIKNLTSKNETFTFHPERNFLRPIVQRTLSRAKSFLRERFVLRTVPPAAIPVTA
ncbi:MAG: hypothetical protein R2682_13610 [Pyrinomonadaceae bacterium]